jgi:nucleotide-binding universal stress UspA family protein
MSVHSVLALTDFSKMGEHALERAALLAASHGACLRVMYFDDMPHPGIVDPDARLAQRARQLARRHQITVEPLPRRRQGLDGLLAHARTADLLVLDARSRWRLMRPWQGPFLDRLLRHCPCPVLVVKREPQQAYARVLVAVDFTPRSHHLLRAACTITTAGELQLFHALSTFEVSKMRSAQVRSDAIEAYRAEAQRHARHRIFALRDSVDTRRTRVMSVIGDGDPARQTAAQQEAIRADLVVVGKRRAAARSAAGQRGAAAHRLERLRRADRAA